MDKTDETDRTGLAGTQPVEVRQDLADRVAPVPARRFPRSVVAALVVVILAIGAAVTFSIGVGSLERLNPFRGFGEQRTVDRSGPVVLKAITDLGEFHAASGYYEVVVDLEHDVGWVPSFLAGDRVLFIAAGTVDSSVSLKGLSSGAVQVNSDRTAATITLPAPTLSRPNLDLGRSYMYSRDRGLINRIQDAFKDDSAQQQKLYQSAAQRLAQAATRTDELRTRAETNTRGMLEGLLHSLGFTTVTVQFTG